MRGLITFFILLCLVVTCIFVSMGVGGLVIMPGLRKQAEKAMNAAQDALMSTDPNQSPLGENQTEPAPIPPTVEIIPTAIPLPSENPTAVIPPVINLLPPGYELVEQDEVGEYYYQLGKIPGAVDSLSETTYFALAANSQPGVRLFEVIGTSVWLDIHSGNDLTGEGDPDLLVAQFSEGVDCCFRYTFLNLGAQNVATYLDTPPSNCTAEFQDLDGDQIYEFLTCDDLLASKYCSFASSPMAPVVLGYLPGQGYQPVTPLYQEWPEMKEKVAIDTQRAESWFGQEPSEADPREQILCPALQVGLDHLYLGDPGLAQSEFFRLYPFEDASQIWQEVRQAVEQSWYFK